MNETEIKQLLEKNKILLEERSELQLDQYDKRYEIKELEDQIIKINNENRTYKEVKKQKYKEFAINMLQIGAIFGGIALFSSIKFLNINPSILNGMYISFGTIFGIVGGILTYIYNDELKDYKKDIGLEYFDKDNLMNLEEAKKVKEEELKKINKRMDRNSRKLDNIYNISNNGLINPIYNNEYSSDESVKSKQKIIEK